MTETQAVVAAFAVVIGGLLLPLPHGVRMGLVLLLIGLVVMTLLGGGMQFLVSMFD